MIEQKKDHKTFWSKRATELHNKLPLSEEEQKTTKKSSTTASAFFDRMESLPYVPFDDAHLGNMIRKRLQEIRNAALNPERPRYLMVLFEFFLFSN